MGLWSVHVARFCRLTFARPGGWRVGADALLGRRGYLDNARTILNIKSAIIERCEQIDGLATWPLMARY